MSVADDAGQWLDDNGVGTLAPLVGPHGVGDDIFTEQMPDEPNAAIVVKRQAGIAPEKVMESVRAAWEKPGVQFIVRGEPRDAEGPETRCELVRDTMDLMHEFTIGNRRYMKVERLGDISFVEMDDKFRRLFSVNFILWQVTA